MPGYTHLKRAEPVTFGHWASPTPRCSCATPPGRATPASGPTSARSASGALSGTPLPIDRARLATALGFARPSANSLDAVSDRDAAAEYLFAASASPRRTSRAWRRT